MKCGFICSGLFWGLILILLGVGIILNVIFGVKIPMFRIILALLIIYLGIKLLVGTSFIKKNKNSVMFEEKYIVDPAGPYRYNVLFGSGKIDISQIDKIEKNTFVEVNVVFGSGELTIPEGMPYVLETSAAFGSANIPDGNNVAFGAHNYRSPDMDEKAPHLIIKASAVFGEFTLRVKGGQTF